MLAITASGYAGVWMDGMMKFDGNAERVRALLGDRFVTEKPRMIAEDFAYYQLNVPGVFVFCGCMDEEHRSPLHADTFDFDERALITGLALFIGLTARKDKENGLV